MLDAGAVRAQDLLLEPADRQDAAAERGLARHRDVAAHRAPAHRADDRRAHRRARARPVLGDRPRRDVHVHLDVAEPVLRDPQPARVRRGVGERGPGALLHDVAQLAREDQRDVAVAGHLHRLVGGVAVATPHRAEPADGRLDEHDVAAHRRVVHAGRDAHLVLLADLLRVDARAAQQLAHLLGVDDVVRVEHVLALARGHAARHLARDRPHLPLELPDAGLPRVLAHDAHHGVVGEGDPLAPQPALVELPRDQVLLRDLGLLALGVAGELDHLHAVHQRAADVLREVGGRDEQALREVEGHAHVVVDEGVVLRRVEHLEQRRRRVALEAVAELVDLVQQEDRVLGARLLHPLDDAARERADVGAPVPADVRLVPRAAQGHADVLAA